MEPFFMEWDLVILLVFLEKYVGMLYDEYQIRRKSLELGIPVLTPPELSESFVKTLEWLQTNETTKKPLQSYEN
jgi:carbamoyl-phosphate synthase large subunit